jgi:hypothetical protein
VEGLADRRRRKRLLALVIALGASALVAESAVRLVVGAPLAERLPVMMVRANPQRGWEMVPGEHYTYQHRVRVNSLGLRGPELGTKALGERRILFLGDSLMLARPRARSADTAQENTHRGVAILLSPMDLRPGEPHRKDLLGP